MRLFPDLLGMTLEAEVGYRCLQHAFVGGLMGVMTGEAVSAPDRSMDELFCSLGLMAHGAEVCSLLDKRDLPVPRMFRLGLRINGRHVAGFAHTTGDRWMDRCGPSHGGVTAYCNTGSHRLVFGMKLRRNGSE